MSLKLRNIRLYGQLGARFGRVHRLAVSNTAEAVRALCIQVKGFQLYLSEAKEKGIEFACFIGKENIIRDQLYDPVGADDIRIAPVVTGCKRGGLLQTIVGAVLIIVGVVLDAFGQEYGTLLIKLGISMVIGGVIQLLSPQPKTGKPGGPGPQSYNFNGPVNTEAQGHPVPLGYGRLRVGSAVISAQITAVDGIYVPSTGSSSGVVAPNPSIGGGGGGHSGLPT